MKKLLLLLALAIGSTFGATAQRSFTVKLGDYAAFAKLNTDGMNFRRLPSATSGKLMEWDSDGGSEDTEMVYFFSDENGNRYRANSYTGAFVTPFHLPVGNVLPIQGTSGEWYKLDMSWLGITGSSQSVYVMQKYCSKIDRGPIGDKSVCPVEAGYDADGSPLGTTLKKVFHRTSGKYTDLAMAVNQYAMNYSEDGGAAVINFPFFIDNKYVHVVSAYLNVVFDNSVSGSMKLQVTQEEDEMGEPFTSVQLVSRRYAQSQLEAAIENYFKTMSDADFQKFIDNALTSQILDNGSTYFRSIPGKYYQVGNISSNDASAITRTFTIGR